MEYREQDIRAMVESVLQSLGALQQANGLAQPAAAASCGPCCADPFPVEVSARHVHLTREAVELLFGPGHQLGKKKMLSQPGEFLSEERVKLVTPKGQIDNVAVLGPERKAVQVELSATDAKSLEVLGIHDVTELIITTGNDNDNLFIAHLANKIYNVPNIYVRLNNPEERALIEETGIKAIYPFQLSFEAFSKLKKEGEK